MGTLTTHVLDTAQGKPGAGMRIDVYSLNGDRQQIKRLQTNTDGRTDETVLSDEEFGLGNWELVFHVGAYFAGQQVPQADPPFLDEVVIRFGLAADQHYHVPLLVSPWSYSTYRGS